MLLNAFQALIGISHDAILDSHTPTLDGLAAVSNNDRVRYLFSGKSKPPDTETGLAFELLIGGKALGKSIARNIVGKNKKEVEIVESKNGPEKDMLSIPSPEGGDRKNRRGSHLLQLGKLLTPIKTALNVDAQGDKLSTVFMRLMKGSNNDKDDELESDDLHHNLALHGRSASLYEYPTDYTEPRVQQRRNTWSHPLYVPLYI